MTGAGKFRSQRGQALALAVVLLGTALLAVYAAFNVGQVASTKMRVMHAADNAAYSAADYQARILNYMAYTNRALITNHVTAAQAVTAVGYTEYQYTNTSNLCNFMCWVPFVGPAINALNQGMQYMKTGTSYGAQGVIYGVNAMNLALSLSQQAIWIGAEARMPSVVRQVARTNHPDAQVIDASLLRTVAEYLRWTKLYRSESERWRFGRTVQNARDTWTATRNNDGLQWLQRTLMGPNLIKDFRFSKRGGTELSDLERWEATDTLSLKFKTLRWKRLKPRWTDGERLPLGWGSATSGSGNTNRKAEAYGRSGESNSTATDFAWNGQQDVAARYQGIGNFVDLLDKSRNTTLQVIVEVFVDQGAVKTANQIHSRLKAGPALRTEDQFVGKRIASQSKAETRFERPEPRQDGSTELASTFNPYWHARLVSQSTSDLLLHDILSGRSLTTLTPYY